MKKRIFAIFMLSVIFMLAFSINAFAHESPYAGYFAKTEIADDHYYVTITNESSEILLYQPPCAGPTGNHHMTGKGASSVWVGNTRVFTGYAFQCYYCRVCLASEGSPFYHTKLGRYVIWPCADSLSSGGITVTVGSYSDIYTNDNLATDPFFRGWEWF